MVRAYARLGDPTFQPHPSEMLSGRICTFLPCRAIFGWQVRQSELTRTPMMMNYSLAAPFAHLCAFSNFACKAAYWRHLRKSLHSMSVAAFLILPLAIATQADETRPEWLPEAIELPLDNDVLTDRSIGSKLRMFSFSTEQNTQTMLQTWEEALILAGYSINQAQDDVIDTIIEFSGQGINNAKIVVAPSGDDARSTINFDATLQ